MRIVEWICGDLPVAGRAVSCLEDHHRVPRLRPVRDRPGGRAHACRGEGAAHRARRRRAARGAPGDDCGVAGRIVFASFELHVCDGRTGRVLGGLHPVMRVADTTLGSPAKRIAVATMEGTGEGFNDLHYGDEVLLLERPRRTASRSRWARIARCCRSTSERSRPEAGVAEAGSENRACNGGQRALCDRSDRFRCSASRDGRAFSIASPATKRVQHFSRYRGPNRTII